MREMRRWAAMGYVAGPPGEVERRGARKEPARPELLGPGLQWRLSQAFDYDLSGVRIWRDSRLATGSTRALVKDGELHFREGAYQPDTPDGERVIAHELAHVVQQQGGRGGRTGAPRELEREADRAAALATRGRAAPITLRAQPGVAYAFDDGEEHAEDLDEAQDRGGAVLTVPRAATDGDAGDHSAELIERALSSPGIALPEDLRARFEAKLGHDFSRVRLHLGGAAEAAARAIHAKAFTIGDHIVFGEGQYRPGTPDGDRLLAHELTHVVQQASGGGGTAPSAAVLGGATARLLAIIDRLVLLQSLVMARIDAEEPHAQKLPVLQAGVAQLRRIAAGHDDTLKEQMAALLESQLPAELLGGEAASTATPVPAPASITVARPPEVACAPLSVSHPADPAEQEAERVASTVVGSGHAHISERAADGVAYREGGDGNQASLLTWLPYFIAALAAILVVVAIAWVCSGKQSPAKQRKGRNKRRSTRQPDPELEQKGTEQQTEHKRADPDAEQTGNEQTATAEKAARKKAAKRERRLKKKQAAPLAKQSVQNVDQAKGTQADGAQTVDPTELAQRIDLAAVASAPPAAEPDDGGTTASAPPEVEPGDGGTVASAPPAAEPDDGGTTASAPPAAEPDDGGTFASASPAAVPGNRTQTAGEQKKKRNNHRRKRKQPVTEQEAAGDKSQADAVAQHLLAQQQRRAEEERREAVQRKREQVQAMRAKKHRERAAEQHRRAAEQRKLDEEEQPQAKADQRTNTSSCWVPRGALVLKDCPNGKDIVPRGTVLAHGQLMKLELSEFVYPWPADPSRLTDLLAQDPAYAAVIYGKLPFDHLKRWVEHEPSVLTRMPTWVRDNIEFECLKTLSHVLCDKLERTGKLLDPAEHVQAKHQEIEQAKSGKPKALLLELSHLLEAAKEPRVVCVQMSSMRGNDIIAQLERRGLVTLAAELRSVPEDLFLRTKPDNGGDGVLYCREEELEYAETVQHKRIGEVAPLQKAERKIGNEIRRGMTPFTDITREAAHQLSGLVAEGHMWGLELALPGGPRVVNLICENAEEPSREALSAYEEALQKTMNSTIDVPRSERFGKQYSQFVEEVRVTWKNGCTIVFAKDDQGRFAALTPAEPTLAAAASASSSAIPLDTSPNWLGSSRVGPRGSTEPECSTSGF